MQTDTHVSIPIDPEGPRLCRRQIGSGKSSKISSLLCVETQLAPGQLRRSTRSDSTCPPSSHLSSLPVFNTPRKRSK